MRPVAVILLVLSATSCHEPPLEGAPPGQELVLFSVELFESESPAPDLSDPRQATSLGRQEIPSWESGLAVYQSQASLVQALPDQGLRAATAAEAGAQPDDGIVVPAGYQSTWQLRLELRPELTRGNWGANGRFQLILNDDYVAVERPVELAPVRAQSWRLDLGRSMSSGGYLFALIEVAP